ncbi:hypothetical protein AAFN85_16985 [Mucilaginibacter sp. CAU 1740]|uniref:class I SAM-dependent methyltransferase n=1 Tax=Mucilaginibacter sp. CAU 1740 TaxID=3140365 RepID=UPI00325C0529
MTSSEAILFIKNAIIGNEPQYWADLGSGNGVFTTALQTQLPPGSHLIPVDKERQNLPDFVKADFEKDDLPLTGLDGILMANSFHYIKDKTKLIKKLETYFTVTPTFLIVEYDTTRANPWVPYPINYQNLQKLFDGLGYSQINKLAETPSRYGGSMYSALIKL